MKKLRGKQVLVTGGTGFIGRALVNTLLEQGAAVLVLTRYVEHHATDSIVGVNYISSLDHLRDDVSLYAVINLAGEPLAEKRWTQKRKEKFVHSRVFTTQALIRLFNRLDSKPEVFISGSAIGWYGDSGDEVLTEDSTAQPGFSHSLCNDWEAAAKPAESYGIRTVYLRIGIVLEKDGGPLKAMLLPFLMGAGGPLGSGEHYWSWIHREDLINAIVFCLDTPIEGAVNAVAPRPVTQKVFSKCLARQLKRPGFLSMPRHVARMVMGEFADEILLSSQRVTPLKLSDAGFRFYHEQLEDALEDIFQ